LYFLLVKAARQERLKAATPNFIRKFISKYVVKAVAHTYDLERRRQRVDKKTILLADYPRCGVNWLRFTLATVLHYRLTGEFRRLEHREMANYTLTISGHAKYQPTYFNDGMSFVKTHSHYFPEFHRAIMIYRNPYEAIKSIYTLERYRLGNISELFDFDLYRGTNRDNLKLPGDKFEGLSEDESFLVYWSKEFVRHHETWLTAIHQRPADFLVVKYEDMLKNCAGLLPAIISFAALDTPPLTAEQNSTLAAMYTRRNSNWPKEEDIAYRNDKFRELESIINPHELERLDANLARRVTEIHTDLDKVRLSPSA
jgi:hypothetical protein